MNRSAITSQKNVIQPGSSFKIIFNININTNLPASTWGCQQCSAHTLREPVAGSTHLIAANVQSTAKCLQKDL